MSNTLLNSHFFSDDGEKIHLIDQGSGTPIVLLHGWTSSHLAWLPFIGTLADRHRLLVWDARGHGGHELASTTLPSIQRIARDLRQMLEHYDLTDVVLVGHSMGAIVSWEYIAQFGTDRLGKLCLIDQSPKLLTDENWRLGIYGDFDQKRAAKFLASLHESFTDAVQRLFAYGLSQTARMDYENGSHLWKEWHGRLSQQNPRPLIQVWESLIQADYRNTLEMIDIPTLLVYGDRSNLYLREVGEYVRAKISNAALRIYENTDHSPHLWQPQRFVSELLTHISGGMERLT